MTPTLVRAEGISWTPRDVPVLGPIDLEVRSGESVAIVGPNGAGKTTLLRLLSGVLRPTSGRLLWKGSPYERVGRKALAREIGYLPQIRPEEIPLTVREIVTLARHPHRSPWGLGLGPDDRRAVDRALDRIGVASLAGRPLTELSGGERQVAFLASIAAQEPTLWTLDEPTGHLDPRHHLDVARLLRETLREGATLVFVTHELPLAGALADRVIALSGGTILADGPNEEVLCPEILAGLFDAPFRIDHTSSGLDPRLRY